MSTLVKLVTLEIIQDTHLRLWSDVGFLIIPLAQKTLRRHDHHSVAHSYILKVDLTVMATATFAEPLLTISAMSLLTEDLAASKAFYTDVFGARVLNEDAESCAVKFNNLIINLLAASAGQELVQPAKVAPPEAGKRFQLSIWVDDLDAAMARLRSKGVTFLSGPEVKPWGLKTVTFDDPAGHNWEIAQDVTK
ncbi:uncharacterized protein G6M90_00g095210 [Metarhizium brunneum]|uniref:VOC domain-containing protein n=1 Tax=Metarhizium brunneum TaxID=500148 RepID=A0A7D5Z6I9_9HYPO|nr:hypothetical protein G6M90_00g095210 [Metarhizium brunneum]